MLNSILTRLALHLTNRFTRPKLLCRIAVFTRAPTATL